MDRPRLALLNASFDDANTPRNFRRELRADLAEFDVNEGAVPPDHDYDGVVVTGSRASVYWDEPWIDRAREYVAGAVEAGLPVLGVCWGHQLLASALGGRVEAMGETELGYREVSLTDAGRAHPVLENVPDPCTVFTTHSDAVVEVPPGATVLAENDCCLQAFGVEGPTGAPAVGVQFHPEYDRETAAYVTRGKDLPEERIESVLAGVTDDAVARADRAKRLFGNFLGVVDRRRARAAD